jgi:hypothetical protein
MNEVFFGKELIITGEVKYVGEGEDPENNPGFIAWKKALKSVLEKEEGGGKSE